MKKKLSSDVSKIISVFENEYYSCKSIVSLVEKIGRNYNTLRAKFWRETGYSMQEYLIRVKLEKAKELLCDQNCMVKQVALRLKYNDEAAFVRQFKKYYGITPGEYQHVQIGKNKF